MTMKKQLCFTCVLTAEEHENFGINAYDPGFAGWKRVNWFIQPTEVKVDGEDCLPKNEINLVILYEPM